MSRRFKIFKYSVIKGYFLTFPWKSSYFVLHLGFRESIPPNLHCTYYGILEFPIFFSVYLCTMRDYRDACASFSTSFNLMQIICKHEAQRRSTYGRAWVPIVCVCVIKPYAYYLTNLFVFRRRGTMAHSSGRFVSKCKMHRNACIALKFQQGIGIVCECVAVLIYCHLYMQCTELTIKTKINLELSSQSHSHRASQQRTYATRAFHRVMQISDAHNTSTHIASTISAWISTLKPI